MRLEKDVAGILCALALVTAGVSPARAADTIETWELGVSDAELYLGYDGVGVPLDEHSLLGDVLLGIGVTPRLSVYAGTTVQGYRRMRAGDAMVNVGLFGTVLDTRHVDLDMILGLGFGGPGFRGITLTPAFELNLDRAPDLAAYGLYFRGALVLAVEANDGVEGETNTFVHHYVWTVGAYLTLAKHHQILVELDAAYHPTVLPAERHLEVGGLALGYNVHLAHWAELITQVSIDLPQRGEQVSVGLQAGVIFTLSRGSK